MSINFNSVVPSSEYLKYQEVKTVVRDLIKNPTKGVSAESVSKLMKLTKKDARTDKFRLFFERIFHFLKIIFSCSYRKNFRASVRKVLTSVNAEKTRLVGLAKEMEKAKQEAKLKELEKTTAGEEGKEKEIEKNKLGQDEPLDDENGMNGKIDGVEKGEIIDESVLDNALNDQAELKKSDQEVKVESDGLDASGIDSDENIVEPNQNENGDSLAENAHTKEDVRVNDFALMSLLGKEIFGMTFSETEKESHKKQEEKRIQISSLIPMLEEYKLIDDEIKTKKELHPLELVAYEKTLDTIFEPKNAKQELQSHADFKALWKQRKLAEGQINKINKTKIEPNLTSQIEFLKAELKDLNENSNAEKSANELKIREENLTATLKTFNAELFQTFIGSQLNA